MIAFGFSLLGAMVHTFKTINFGTRALIGYRDPNKVRLNKITKIATLSCLVALTVLAASAENPVTRSELYVELEQQTEEKAGIPVALAIRTVVQLQPFAYPVSEHVRALLGGITYDFDPETSTPAFENFDLVFGAAESLSEPGLKRGTARQ